MNVGLSLDLSVIRGGTSRGVFVRAGDLPSEPGERAPRLLRVFGNEAGILADGVGGENPVLRKIAIVEPLAPEGQVPRVGYRFAQVSSTLESLAYVGECGNLAAGVPLFAALQGWCASPEPGKRLWIELLNTGRRIRAEWLEVCPGGGRVSLTLVEPAGRNVLPLGQAQSSFASSNGIRTCSVVSAFHHYIFFESSAFGIHDPTVPGAVDETVYNDLECVEDQVAERLSVSYGAIRSCLVAPGPAGPDSIRCLVVYPRERRTHPAFPVTGAATVAVGGAVRGSVPGAACDVNGSGRVSIHHPSGTLEVRLERGADDLPFEVSLERSTRLIMSGTAY